MTRIANVVAIIVTAFSLSACGIGPEDSAGTAQTQVESVAQPLGGLTTPPGPEEGCTSGGGWITCTYPIATVCPKGWNSCVPSGSDAGCCKRRATGM